MATLKTVADKMAALKSRKDSERALGAQIDRALAHADMEQPGCGLCHIWKRMTGKQRTVALSSAVEGASSTAVSTVSTGSSAQARLFGMKKADPHAKLVEAAATMESRILQLESKAAAEREETKKQMQAGQKASAMRMLKRAKATEKQLEANQASLLAVEQQVDLMAQAAMQKQVASALSASSKGMKAQKKLLKNAESAVDDAQEARDMADDLGNVMSEFASNGNGNDDDDDLLLELQSMMDDDTNPPAAQTMEAVLDDQNTSTLAAELAKKQEIAMLEARLARYDESAAVRDAVAQMPPVPVSKQAVANGKGKMTQHQIEKEALLANGNGHV